MPSSSFSTKRLNSTTFVITEDDKYREHPLIYAKVHPKAPIIVLSDTGCDEPSEKRRNDRIIHLREFIETYPLPCNNDSPLNPGGKRTYVVLCTHCHYDHLGGIMQFLRGGKTSIVASAAGRDFVESNLGKHGLFENIGEPTPYFKVTNWAQAFERLHWPLPSPPDSPISKSSKPVDLGITIIQTPGHTPDELAWYDHAEKHLYVGDSFYEEGKDGMPVEWPAQGNLIEWQYSMMKLQCFIKSENARLAERAAADGEESWVTVAERVKIGCGHQTASADGEEIMERLFTFWWRVLGGKVSVAKTRTSQGEVTDWWREPHGKGGISFQAPRRLMEDARRFFNQ